MTADNNGSKAKISKPYFRGRHRAMSHDSAHADVENGSAPPQVPVHPGVSRDEASLIIDEAHLVELIAHLRSVGRFAYDSEFIGELTYVPKLCLIQVASEQRVALIDPLADFDLRPFWELICDPSLEKIVHAGSQDIEPVFRHTGKEAANIFDTQIAAGFIGMAYPVSLSRLVHTFMGVKLGKGLTFSYWDKRPLSPSQLRYAADDVRYLPAMRAEIGRRLDELGHTAWAKEECDAMCDASQYGFDPNTQYLRVRGAGSLPPKELAILRELTIWRDAAARANDLPPRAFLRDDVMVDLARSPIKSLEKLAKVRGLPKPIEREYGMQIIEATRRALDLPAEAMPQPRQNDETPVEKFRADGLWAATQCLCDGRCIDPNLVTNRAEIGKLLRNLNGPDASAGNENNERQTLRLLKSWRREAVGEPLLKLMRGDLHLDVRWHDGALATSARKGE